MSIKAIFFILFIGWASLTACSSSHSNTVASASATSDSLELPLPEVPSDVTAPSARAAYYILHFWDALDFTDTVRTRNRDFLEQNFVNFIDFFQYADLADRKKAVDTLLSRARTDEATFNELIDIAEIYLYEPDSPMRSEDDYALFLNYIVETAPNYYDTLGPREQLDQISKNRPGMCAADFSFTTREGKKQTLHGVRSRGDILLIFYDPDCDHCVRVINQFAKDADLNDKIRSGAMTVLAVYSGDNRPLWDKTKSSLPSQWIVGFEPGDMQEQGKFVIRTMPTLYLLTSDHIVKQKEIHLSE